MVHQQGTSTGEISGGGFTYSSRGGFGYQTFTGSQTQRSTLARRCAPPEEPSQAAAVGQTILCSLVGWFVLLVALSYVVDPITAFLPGPVRSAVTYTIASGLFLFSCYLSCAKVYGSYRDEAATFEERCREWADSWICLDCGATFMRDSR